MEERINKPRVFLSHSQKNSEFIEKLDNDLRKCQIDTWLFTVDIRHGKSWQDSIFESGIPTCDAVIVYLTEASLQSAVVKKEIDVALLQNLRDNNIAFLPYVDDANFRTELRPDIQALQVPEWNYKNYQSLLPRVVAEIWRSFLEKAISTAIKSERLKRVEAELEKYKSQADDMFSKAENKEFEYILNSFSENMIFLMTEYVSVKESGREYMQETVKHKFKLQLLTTFPLLNELFTTDYAVNEFYKALQKHAHYLVGSDPDSFRGRFKYKDREYITKKMLTHGLIEIISYPVRSEDTADLDSIYQFTNKYFRLRLWMAYNKKLPEQILVEVVENH